MLRKVFMTVAAVGLLLVIYGGYAAMGQEAGDAPIVTTATDAVGVGTYVSAQAFAFVQGEDPATHPQVAIILPYGVHAGMQVTSPAELVQPEPLVEGFTWEWSLVGPDGSAAALEGGDEVVIFMPDVEGAYDLTLVATSADGVVAETTWTVYATTYVGSGYLDGPEDAEDQCIDCHDDVAAGWLLTGHASAFVSAAEFGYLSEENISHFTTGYWENAENNGFDDIAAAAGWTIPEASEEAWETTVAEFPEVASMANVQCEACHGPGYLHVFEASRSESMIGTGMSAGTCASCHADAPEPIPQQWELSGHGDINAEAFTYPIGEDRQACARCHSGVGYIDFAAGLPQEEWRTDYQPITCAVCHDPHDVSNPNQLRVFDTVSLPNGVALDDAGPAATCMSCHNTRRDAVATVDKAASGEANFGTPHYSTAGELMTGTGGYTWGLELPTSPHGWVVEDACIGCHMAQPVSEEEAAEGDSPHATAGGHTFSMYNAEGEEFVEVCQVCHTDAEGFDFEAFRDYDGDGTIETNFVEVDGLMELLSTELETAGVVFLDSHPYFEFPEGTTDANLFAGVYNYKFVQNGGGAVHNLKYTVSLLQLSIQQLTGAPVPNAYLLEAEAVPE